MGGCISRLSIRRETSQDDGPSQEADFAAQLDSVQSVPPRSIDEQEHAAGPSSEADRGTTSQPIRPARIDEKLQLLGQTLQRASQAGLSSGLVDYGQQVARYLSADIQTDEKLLSLDVDNIDRLADSYNERYPDLNLRYMGSPAGFLEALTDRSSTGAWRAIVRLADGEAHHFAADVRTRAGAAPTVIAMEPADLYTFIAPYSRLRRETLQQLGTEPKWAFIGVGVQKSASDCVMFSMQSTLAARQNSSTFDDWHNNLRRRGTIADERDVSSDYMASPDAMLEHVDINLFHGEKMLPALFYKHSHSGNVIEEAASNRLGFRDEDVSTSSRAPKSESLAERRDAFAVQRGPLNYSASIETSRATKIRKALDSMLSD
ncbi:YopJ family acetyltransferase [Bradyrhizobium brasilense]|uniref:YopJ family acetyltransferase n=1 Tax=Bradyrhizobium brasilense TaxID=1419277 RepID=UPI0024B1E106|nr:YopJ family acetyltransferase [Bradyrhizobium australafricanum]WFU31533.1 YopJ family acetyltransferase [Bradyrhizobium australafricanum]